MPPREPSPRKFPPADWRAVLSVCVSACEVLGLFWEIPGQSADSSRLAFVSFTSESSPQVVAYFGVAMATAHGNPSVVEKKGRKKNQIKYKSFEWTEVVSGPSETSRSGQTGHGCSGSTSLKARPQMDRASTAIGLSETLHFRTPAPSPRWSHHRWTALRKVLAVPGLA